MAAGRPDFLDLSAMASGSPPSTGGSRGSTGRFRSRARRSRDTPPPVESLQVNHLIDVFVLRKSKFKKPGINAVWLCNHSRAYPRVRAPPFAGAAPLSSVSL